MEKKLIQVVHEDGFVVGMYMVPKELSQEDFEAEFMRFEEQEEFDEGNNINAEREFIAEEYVI